VTDAAVRTQEAALADARDLAATLSLPDGARLLCPVSERYADPRVALALLALPLAVGGSVVLLDDASADVGSVADVERCDAVLR
jgi:hypothetical protein